MTRETVIEILGILSEVYGREVSPVLAQVYHTVLAGYPDGQVREAVNRAVRTLRFFPKPAEILEILEGTPDDRSMLAWQALENAIRRIGSWESVRFEDGALSAAVEALGGWTKVCEWTEAEMPFRRQEFERLYRVFHARGVRGPDWHPGHIEASNRQNGWTAFIPAPRTVDAGYGLPGQANRNAERLGEGDAAAQSATAVEGRAG